MVCSNKITVLTCCDPKLEVLSLERLQTFRTSGLTGSAGPLNMTTTTC